jgi:hypothetical protein
MRGRGRKVERVGRDEGVEKSKEKNVMKESKEMWRTSGVEKMR